MATGELGPAPPGLGVRGNAMGDKLALVFTGGGAKGAFGAGVLSAIVEAYPRLRWHIVTGTSTGSLIAPLAALGVEDRAQIRRLEAIYRGARKKKILSSNLDLCHALLLSVPQGLYTMKPLARLIAREFPDDLLARLGDAEVAAVVCAVDLVTGRLVLCCQDRFADTLKAHYQKYVDQNVGQLPIETVPFSRFREMVVASSSIPFAVDPAEVAGMQLVDGGIREFAPLRAAIAIGATHAIVITMDPLDPSVPASTLRNLFTIGLHAIDLLEDEVLRGDLATATEAVSIRSAARGFSLDVPSVMAALGSGQRRGRLVEYLSSDLVELPVVIAPRALLGERFDFDSKVSPEWPENPDSVLPATRPIMDARADYGHRATLQAISTDASLRGILDQFST
jgi:NTE family protein